MAFCLSDQIGQLATKDAGPLGLDKNVTVWEGHVALLVIFVTSVFRFVYISLISIRLY